MKIRTKAFLAFALCFMMLLSACSNADTPSSDAPANPSTAGGSSTSAKEVVSLEVTKMPTTTLFYVGDSFSAEGGELTITYSDGTTDVLSLTASDIELSSVNTNKAGSKTVTVQYGGKKTTFKVSVQAQGFAVTLDLNYEGAPAAETVNAVKNDVMDKPEDPTRDGYSFYNWFIDADCTKPFDFSDEITSDLHLYAAWKEDGTSYHEVTYDVGYYGIKDKTFTQLVKDGETVKALDLTPARDEYTFDGWFVGGTPFDASQPITGDTTIVGGWTKTKTGTSTYVFEAENTDLTGKIGPGFSGTAQEESMIVTDDKFAPSAGRFVSYMYQNGNSLEFYIASGEAVPDATLVISVAAEMENINFGPDEFQVLVNGKAQNYSSVRLTENSPFSDAIEINNVSLNEGENLIQLVVTNSIRPLGESGTYAATAPMIDCIKITTSSVLTWDASQGLPKSY